MDDSDPSEIFSGVNSLGYVLRRCLKLMTQQAEQLFEGHSFTFTQWITLMLVGSGAASSPAEVARNLGHNSGATTRMIDQLEAQGLLARRRETDDRRVVALSLTPEGTAVVERYRQYMAAHTHRVLSGFDLCEVQFLMFLLGRLLAALEAAGGG